MSDHERLIEALAQGVTPVRRVLPAWVRTACWVPVALALGMLSTSLLSRAPTDWAAQDAGIAVANVLVSLAIGVCGVASALSTSVADGRFHGKWLVAALSVVWLALAAVSIGSTPPGFGRMHHGTPCFVFVMTAGIPMVLAAVVALRRTRSLTPVRSLVLAGGGAAFLSFALLALCHPVELSAGDFAMHLAAALVLVGGAVALGRRAVAG